MIDIGSSIDILYFDNLQKLGLPTNDTLMTFSMMGFTNDSISPFRTVNLHAISKMWYMN